MKPGDRFPTVAKDKGETKRPPQGVPDIPIGQAVIHLALNGYKTGGAPPPTDQWRRSADESESITTNRVGLAYRLKECIKQV